MFKIMKILRMTKKQFTKCAFYVIILRYKNKERFMRLDKMIASTGIADLKCCQGG